MKTKIIFFLLLIPLFVYYQSDYKRHILSNSTKSEFITVWMRYSGKCFIIPGKYYWPFKPKNNFVETVNHRNYLGIIWNTEDEYDSKIYIYNEFESKLKANIKLYDNHNSLLMEYGILKDIEWNRKRIYSPNSKELREKFDYVYIDMNRVYGIKVYYPKELLLILLKSLQIKTWFSF